jgi:hypothetical protein
MLKVISKIYILKILGNPTWGMLRYFRGNVRDLFSELFAFIRKVIVWNVPRIDDIFLIQIKCCLPIWCSLQSRRRRRYTFYWLWTNCAAGVFL